MTVFPPAPQTFSMQPPGGGAAAKVQQPVIYVDFPDFRTQLVCTDGKLIALRQGRVDITAPRPGDQGTRHWPAEHSSVVGTSPEPDLPTNAAAAPARAGA